MEIDNIKDVLGKIMTINKNLNEESLRHLLTAANWDIDDITQAIDVFKYYTNNSNKINGVESKENTASELYAELRDKENEKKKQEIEKAKAEINETMIQNQLDSYLDSIVSKIVDNEYLKRLNIEIETLRSDLLNWKSSPEYKPQTTEEQILNKKIDAITFELEKVKRILEENRKNIENTQKIEAQKNMEIIQDIPDSVKDDKVSEEGILTFVKDVPTQPIVENIDVNNVKADMPENRSVSTLILAFLDSLLILFILILILYMLIY